MVGGSSPPGGATPTLFYMGKIIYAKHSLDKLVTAESIKFKITKKKIKKAVNQPFSREALPTGVIRITKELDKKHSLCVVYKKIDKNTKIITFFPAEKGRYESKVLS